jgi:hypothetical protein
MNESDISPPDEPVHAPLSEALGASSDELSDAIEHENKPELVVNRRDELRRQELDSMREKKRQERSGKARKTYRVSRLYRHRHDLLSLRKCGASYGEMREWLKEHRKVTVATTTIIRFLAPFLESSHEPDKNA